MESTNRNNQGRFVSGHKGAKPKGAINKSTRDYLARLDKINQLLETSLEDNILSLSKKEQVMFWLEIQKFIHGKLSKFSEPEPEKEKITKVTFNIVGSSASPLDDPPAPPSSADVHPGIPVPSTGNATAQYGSNDLGKVRSPGRFSRTSRIK
jgi:hypothetical protein